MNVEKKNILRNKKFNNYRLKSNKSMKKRKEYNIKYNNSWKNKDFLKR